MKKEKIIGCSLGFIAGGLAHFFGGWGAVGALVIGQIGIIIVLTKQPKE